MARTVFEVKDDRGDHLEAHCERHPSDRENVFHVSLMSSSTLRGSFVADVPGNTTLEEVVAAHVLREGIHARN